MSTLNKISDLLEKYLANLVGIALLFSTCVLSVNVFGRYVLGNSMVFAEELATYTIIWLTFVGSGVCVKRGIHVGVDAFTLMLPQNGQKFFKVFTNVIGLAFSICLLYIGSLLCMQVFHSLQTSPALRAPMFLVYLAIPTGAVYMTIEYVKILLDMAFNGVVLDDDEKLIEKSV